MITSSFVQFGDKNRIVFNVSQITHMQAENVTITDINRESYNGFPRDIDQAYCIMVYLTGRRSMELIYESEAVRDAMFDKILSTLNPLVIAKPTLLKDTISAPASDGSSNQTS